ncbi:hypothetical protein SAY87_015917 [Trapa incisa]|uniref:Uncharacterized protein n=1 Tax=Trapa incisa TaxID=236973 RepID=A0AAN7LFS5_9MYRT|nr:hypothetical protein SAY87_015917 [Trapa incisa]
MVSPMFSTVENLFLNNDRFTGQVPRRLVDISSWTMTCSRARSQGGSTVVSQHAAFVLAGDGSHGRGAGEHAPMPSVQLHDPAHTDAVPSQGWEAAVLNLKLQRNHGRARKGGCQGDRADIKEPASINHPSPLHCTIPFLFP